MRRIDLLILLVLLSQTCRGLEIDSVGQKESPYRWIQTVGSPNYLDHMGIDLTGAISFSLSNNKFGKKLGIERLIPENYKHLGIEQHLTIGQLNYSLPRVRYLVGDYYRYHSSEFVLRYSMLEWHVPIIDEKLLKITLLAGGGLGHYSITSLSKEQSMGYILSSGTQIQLWRFIADARINSTSGIPEIFFASYRLGVQGKTWYGGVATTGLLILLSSVFAWAAVF